MASFTHISVYKELVKHMETNADKLAEYISKNQSNTFVNDLRYRTNYDDYDITLEIFMNGEYDTMFPDDNISHRTAVKKYLESIGGGVNSILTPRERLESIKNNFGEDSMVYIDYLYLYLKVGSYVDVDKVRTNCMVIPNMFNDMLGMADITPKKCESIIELEKNSLFVPGVMYYVLSGTATTESHAFMYICPPKGCNDYLVFEAIQDKIELRINILSRNDVENLLRDSWEKICWYKRYVSANPNEEEQVHTDVRNGKALITNDPVKVDNRIIYEPVTHHIPIIKVFKVFLDEYEELDDYEYYFDCWMQEAVSEVKVIDDYVDVCKKIKKNMSKSIKRACRKFWRKYDDYA